MPTPEEIAQAEAKAKEEKEKAEKNEHMIPKFRFDEVNTERQKLADQLAAIQAEQKAETEKRLAEQNQFKELAEKRGDELVKAQAEAAKVADYEKTLSAVLASQIELIPEGRRGLVPEEMTTKQKLDWISKNAAILKAPDAFDIGAGRHGGENNHNAPELTAEERQFAQAFGVKEEDYVKHR